LEQKHIEIGENDILYTTLEPCSARFDSTGGAPDCTTLIQRAGIKNVVYSASDPVQTIITHKRCDVFGINLKQTDNQELQEKARRLFNKLDTGYQL
jgi:pyrimidine deaminase RibD-like protein